MIVTICNKKFNSEEIRSIHITSTEVFVETEEDYFALRYLSEEELVGARNWLKFQNITNKDLLDAVNLLIITCDYYINSKTQCYSCPLKRKEECIFNYMPIDWRN